MFYRTVCHGGIIGAGFCKYDITTADTDNIKLDNT